MDRYVVDGIMRLNLKYKVSSKFIEDNRNFVNHILIIAMKYFEYDEHRHALGL